MDPSAVEKNPDASVVTLVTNVLPGVRIVTWTPATGPGTTSLVIVPEIWPAATRLKLIPDTAPPETTMGVPVVTLHDRQAIPFHNWFTYAPPKTEVRAKLLISGTSRLNRGASHRIDQATSMKLVWCLSRKVVDVKFVDHGCQYWRRP